MKKANLIDLVGFYLNAKIKQSEFERFRQREIELIVYDFDGVMTNNKVTLNELGHESVMVNRSDGLAISELKRMGIPQIILSTEKNKVVQQRAKKLGIPCFNGIQNKRYVLEDYIHQNNISKANVAYLGNDINDLECMRLVGFPIAPSDADWKIKKIAKFITKAKGGDGVIREIMNIIGTELYEKANFEEYRN